MPRGDPFTSLCRLAAGLSRPAAADLHLHTTASDGEYTPSQVVAFAGQARLDAIAVTDHDTFAGVGAAEDAARGTTLRVIPGIELTTEWNGREVHLLGYFPGGLSGTGAECGGVVSKPSPGTLRVPPSPCDPELDAPAGEGSELGLPSPPVRAADGFRGRGAGGEGMFDSRLTEMCDRRRERFRDFIRLIRDGGHALDEGLVRVVEAVTASLGRRHVASLLVRTGVASTRREAWQRFVGPLGKRVVPKLMVPFAEATEWVRDAGGLSSLAHPSPDLSESELTAMIAAGLGGVEVKFPAAGLGRSAELRAWAGKLGLVATGGSDCHGGDGRAVGSCGVTAEELRAVCEVSVR